MKIACKFCQFENPTDIRFCSNCGNPLQPADDIHLAKTLTLATTLTHLKRGDLFANRYEVIEELGKGGMGSVYRVLDRKINEEVALKLIRPEIVDEKALERFSNELKYTRNISHRNVCKMFDLDEEKGTHFITMEYIPGEDLKSMIKMTRQLGVKTSIFIAKQICEGLGEAHQHGIVHRDLKPSNIIIDKEGNARIMDFGIARSLKKGRKTSAGILVGTPEYMSPEQVEAREADKRSDIYSLGIILFEMLTGRVPFDGDDPIGIAIKHKLETPPSPKKFNPDIPDDLNRLILKCLEKDQENRYQTTDELFRDLVQIEKNIPITDHGLQKRKSITSKEITVKLTPKKLILPSILLLAMIIGGVFGWRYFFGESAALSPENAVSLAVVSFENQTGDPAFDYLQDVIPNLLITSLEQSKSFRVTSWERLRDLIEQMGKKDVSVIDRDLGFELCRLDGIQAIILGSFTKAENTFVTDVKVLDVQTKSLLKSVSSQGDGADSIIRKQIDKLSRKLCQEVGITAFLPRIGGSTITDVTTDSLEAYNFFLRGREDFERYYYNDARRFLERAVELDPEFALAYYYLIRVYSYLGHAEEMEAASEKFKKYGKKLKGREGLYIKALLIQQKDPEKYAKILKELIEKYPKWKRPHYDLAYYYYYAYGQDKIDEAIAELNTALDLDPNYGPALNQLAYCHLFKNEFEKALEYFRRYASISPGDANPFDSMGEAYFRMGRLDESIEKYKEALEVKPDFGSEWRISYIYALKQDYEEAMRWLDQFIAMASTESLKAQGHLWKGFYYYLQGKLRQSLEEVDKAQELAGQANNLRLVDVAYRSKIWIASDWEKLDLYQEFVEGRMAFCERTAYRTPEENAIFNIYYQCVLDIKNDQLASARSRLAELRSILSKMTEDRRERNKNTERFLLSHLLLAEGSVDEAMKIFEEIPSPSQDLFNFYDYIYRNLPFGADFSARGLLKKGEIDNAIAEYEKLTTFDPTAITVRLLVHPLGHLRLAKLYEERELREKAIEQYEKALAFWTDADEGLLPVKEAREGLSRLQHQ
jgi:serine/threonine protein kinase/Tfp pilus assembly protein PilF